MSLEGVKERKLRKLINQRNIQPEANTFNDSTRT